MYWNSSDVWTDAGQRACSCWQASRRGLTLHLKWHTCPQHHAPSHKKGRAHLKPEVVGLFKLLCPIQELLVLAVIAHHIPTSGHLTIVFFISPGLRCRQQACVGSSLSSELGNVKVSQPKSEATKEGQGQRQGERQQATQQKRRAIWRFLTDVTNQLTCLLMYCFKKRSASDSF